MLLLLHLQEHLPVCPLTLVFAWPGQNYYFVLAISLRQMLLLRHCLMQADCAYIMKVAIRSLLGLPHLETRRWWA